MATKLQNNQKKVIAHDYFRLGYSQIEISQKIDVSQQTLSKWAKEGLWKEERNSITQTRQELLKQYHDQLSELNRTINNREEGKRMPTKPEADVMTQVLNAIQKIENDASVSEIISVFTDFLDFIRGQAPHKALEISDYCDAFIKSKM
ncbi:MAG: DDE transposase family protein [Bacteroidales bacterium]